MFASGANDNYCRLYDANDVLAKCCDYSRADFSSHGDAGERRTSNGRLAHPPLLFSPFPGGKPLDQDPEEHARMLAGIAWMNPDVNRRTSDIDWSLLTGLPYPARTITSAERLVSWRHGAAVKAIAFCPWQSGLLATGGGSTDKSISFWHTGTGACIASIHTSAQVTGLVWSTTRREICATFGYAQPDHPIRVAVYSWPACAVVATIPWAGDHRALSAVMHSADWGVRSGLFNPIDHSRTVYEGCLVVAGSDCTIKFHEIWPGKRCDGRLGGNGMLGSPIFELVEDIDPEAEAIR